MQYLINDDVVFRPADGALWHRDQPDELVVLATIPNRIFTHLLECSDKAISRDEFFTEVWDKYGLQSSNNSLNQNISLIRKMLQDLGCDVDIIQTIPHVGYQINSSLVSPIVSGKKRSDIKVKVQARRGWQKYAWVAGFALILVLLGVVAHLIQGDVRSEIPAQKLFALGEVDGCKVYTLHDNSNILRTKKLEIAKNAIESYLACGSNEFYIFQPEDGFVYSGKGRIFLSRCTYQDNASSNFAGCKDVYIHEN